MTKGWTIPPSACAGWADDHEGGFCWQLLPIMPGAKAPPLFSTRQNHERATRHRSFGCQPSWRDPLPSWLAESIRRPIRPVEHTQGATEPVTAAYFRAAIERATRRVLLAPNGTRSDTLNHEAYALSRLLPWAEDGEAIAAALTTAGLAAGLTPHEVERMIRSAFVARERTGP